MWKRVNNLRGKLADSADVEFISGWSPNVMTADRRATPSLLRTVCRARVVSVYGLEGERRSKKPEQVSENFVEFCHLLASISLLLWVTTSSSG